MHGKKNWVKWDYTMTLPLETKARTLQALLPVIKTAKVLPVFKFNVEQFSHPESVCLEIQRFFKEKN